MNYKKLHDDAILYFRESKLRDRIKKRNSNDYRLDFESIYVEIHHILPRSLGGTDMINNLVEVLPEEHIFLHMLRYKIYRKREDMLAVRFMLNWFDNKSMYIDVRPFLSKKIRMGYSWLRTHSANLRKSDGWQTKDGIRRISESRRGTMPVRDVETGQIVGSVPTSHPNVLSGNWVHHSKGRKQSEKEILFKKQFGLGQNNPNASGLSEEYFVQKGIETFKEFGIILSWSRMSELSQTRGFKWIKSLSSRFSGEGMRGYYKELENKLNIKYDPYKSRTIVKKNQKLK